MARFVTMRILSDHTCTENWQVFFRIRSIRKHAIQLFRETLLAAQQTDQAVQILRNIPEILPCITFADIFRIIFRIERSYEITLFITRLHKGRFRIIDIAIVL